ncbi:MAG: histidine phosphatase family protein [Pseudomonadota bacterium]|nr:histidine phosphatase family protein [Pseudomonadota bacterium]QKK06290.1 MAG: histidine phosphatase family protein [Pseudomonadota bacterium]
MTEKKKGTLIVLRHGQTGYNAAKKMTGQKNVPLTEKGEEQARGAGKLLAATHVDKVYASPLDRAFKTAELILDHMDDAATAHLKNEDGTWNVHQDYDIMEQDTGDFTGRHYKTDPDIIAFDRQYAQAFPGGESAADVQKRLEEFYDRELKPLLEDGKTVMVVCHSNVVRAFKLLAGEATPETYHEQRAKVKNASPWVLEFDSCATKVSASYMVEDRIAAQPPTNDNASDKNDVDGVSGAKQKKDRPANRRNG